MKKKIFLKIFCFLVIIFVLFLSSQLAFASDDNTVTYNMYLQLDDTQTSKIYNRVEKWETTVTCSPDYIPFLYIYRTTSSTYNYCYYINLCLYKDGKIYTSVASAITYYYINGVQTNTFSNFGGVGGYFCYSSNLDCILSTSCPYYYGSSSFVDGMSIDVDDVIGGGLDFIKGNNYNKNGFTNYSSDIFYPSPMSISYCNDIDDSINYDNFRMSFNVLPENCRYSNISNYELEIWVLDTDRRIYVNSYALGGLQYQSHSGGGSWGSDSGGSDYYVFEGKLHDIISFVDELQSPLILEFRLVYRINDTSYLESGYVDVTVDLASGSILSVDYYDDGMKEDDVVNENPEVLPEVVQPSNPNGYIFNIDWENSNLDDFVKQNFGIKNYIIALKDTLSFLPDFFWTMQFFLLGAISSIGIYKLVIK